MEKGPRARASLQRVPLSSLSLSLIGSCQYLSVSGNRAMNRNVINYLLHTTGQARRQISSVSRANAAAMHAPYNPSHPRLLTRSSTAPHSVCFSFSTYLARGGGWPDLSKPNGNCL